ncbi:MAG: fused response regulator/phosphatase [Rhodocyclales bacterium]|nr:fused response regulator/phosphatase [Rhodocyclales bacterium]
MDASVGSGIKVLVADDQKANRHILEVFLRREGHTVVVANDGAEAVALHRQERPDLVLMDIMMPVMDGLEAARLINAESGEIHTPILFLSMLNDRQTMLDGLELADDFIPKPINFGLLRAKLRAFIRQVQIHRTFRVQQRRIELYNEEMRRESEVASFILNRVLAHTEPPNGNALQYKVVPSALFSGDVVFARRTPSGRLHVLLADAVGHGLPAAINILPLFFPFDGMSRKGYPISTVARELNRRIRDLLPIDRFVAATLVSIDAEAGVVEIWNGGNPPALLVRPDGRIAERVDSMQVALGINEDDPALFVTQRLPFSAGQQLILFSDGIWENPAFAGEDPATPMEALLAATPAAERMDALVAAAIAAGQGDDLSAGVLTQREAVSGRGRPAGAPAKLTTDRLSMQLGVESLRSAGIVEEILAMAGALGFVAHFPNLPSIFSELFANALEHGILNLPTGNKYRSSEGYLEYFEEKERRLAQLADGFIAVEMALDCVGGEQALRLIVADSGSGFKPGDLPADVVADAAGAAQRGLRLVSDMALHLSHNKQGNEAIVLIGSVSHEEMTMQPSSSSAPCERPEPERAR